MRSRLGTGVGLVLALLATTTLLPLATADHAYSHRYVIFGRVIDSEGNPVPGLTVVLGFQDVAGDEGPCAAQPGTETAAFGRTETRPVTSDRGEFMFCRHIHSMSRALPGVGRLFIQDLNVTEDFELTPYFRTSYVVVKLDEPHAGANKNVAATEHTVMARLWRESSSDHVEGIRVFGETVNNAHVNVTLEYDGKTVRTNATTNNYGDLAIRIPVESRPTSGRVTLEAFGESITQEIDPASGATHVSFEMDKVSSGALQKVLYVGAAVVLVGAVGAGSWYAIRQVAARREEASIRANAQRKRANK